jgi:hypothetical protein
MEWDDGIGAKWNHLRDRTKLLVIFGGAFAVGFALLTALGIGAATDGDPATKDEVGVGTAVMNAYGWTTHQLGADNEPTRLGCRSFASAYDPNTDDELAVALARNAKDNLKKVYDPELRRMLFTGELERRLPKMKQVYEWCRVQLPDDRLVKRWEP